MPRTPFRSKSYNIALDNIYNKLRTGLPSLPKVIQRRTKERANARVVWTVTAMLVTVHSSILYLPQKYLCKEKAKQPLLVKNSGKL